MKASLEKQRASVAAQREAARKQAELAGPSPLERTLVMPEDDPGCEPLPESEIAPLISAAAKDHAVEPLLLRAVIQQESSFLPCAISVHGAKGLMQLMPAAIEQLGVNDPFDPKENIEAGARYLNQLLARYKGDLKRAVGAYRIGPSVIDQANGLPDNPEVKSYVEAILQKLATPPPPPQIPMPKPTGN
jgi:soluble lytic murein transglycosylase-like protein